MAKKDYRTAIEVDPGADITVNEFNIAIAGMNREIQAYLYWDEGVAHFDGDFSHLVDLKVTLNAYIPTANFWALTNVVDTYQGIVDASGDMLCANFFHTGGNAVHVLREINAGALTQDVAIGLPGNTIYYHKIYRIEADGVFGTLYDEIYSNEARTVLEDTISVALTEKQDFQNVFGFQNSETGTGNPLDCNVYNLDLQEAVAVVGHKVIGMFGIGILGIRR